MLIEFGSASFDTESRLLLDKENKLIDLRPKSLVVLEALLARAGEVCSKDDLLNAAWGDVNVTEESLTQCIADIRRAIGDKEKSIVVTLPKRGYRLAVTPKTNVRRGWMSYAVGLSVLLALAVGFLFWSNAERDSSRDGPSIAVLPFEVLDGSQRWERIGRGLAADLAGDLARHEAIYVTAPASVHAAIEKHSSEDVNAGLNVRLLLRGTIVERDNIVRISATLIDSRDQSVVWSNRWHRPSSEIFEVMSEVIDETYASIGSLWSGAIAEYDRTASLFKSDGDLTSYELFLQGSDFVHKFSLDGYLKGAELLEQAVAREPDFARAWAKLGVAYGQAEQVALSATERAKFFELSEKAHLRAFQVGPNEPSAMMSQFIANIGVDSPSKNEALLQELVKSAPNNADILAQAAWVGNWNSDVGEDTLAWAQRAIDLHPFHPDWYWASLGIAAFYAGDYERALESLAKAPEDVLDRHMYEAAAAALLGDDAAASLAVEKIHELTSQDFTFADRTLGLFHNTETWALGLQKAGLALESLAQE